MVGEVNQGNKHDEHSRVIAVHPAARLLIFVPRPDDNTEKDSVLSEAKVKASAEVRLT
jgi:hypothetical protein